MGTSVSYVFKLALWGTVKNSSILIPDIYKILSRAISDRNNPEQSVKRKECRLIWVIVTIMI